MKLGLIAGNGRFPFLLLDAARAHGAEVVVAAIKEEADAEMDERKRIFANNLLMNVPLAAHIQKVLQERPNHRAAGDAERAWRSGLSRSFCA